MIFSTPIQNPFYILSSSFIEICLLFGVLDRFLDFQVLWFSRLLFKIDGWNFQRLNKFTFNIFFLSSLIMICLLVRVLKRFLYCHNFLPKTIINFVKNSWFILSSLIHMILCKSKPFRCNIVQWIKLGSAAASLFSWLNIVVRLHIIKEILKICEIIFFYSNDCNFSYIY